VIPTAVAMVVDHCLFDKGLHRVEVAIRPENTASLRVVQKLGFSEYGYAPRYLHINGAWRDHRLFAITVEECPGGLLRRYKTRAPDEHG
jgi:ribosomal-protein-alanine N-acetyltransferase